MIYDVCDAIRLRCLAGGFIALLLTGCATNVRSVTQREPVDYGPAPDFTLPNVMGGSFHLRDAAPRIVILTFVTADCTEECPKVEAVLVSAARTLQAQSRLPQRVEIATIEIDPSTNSVAAVRRLHDRIWPSAGWQFLRGSRAETQRILAAYDVSVEPRQPGKDLVHASWVYVIDRNLREAELFAPKTNLSPKSVVTSVDKALKRNNGDN